MSLVGDIASKSANKFHGLFELPTLHNFSYNWIKRNRNDIFSFQFVVLLEWRELG